MSIPGNRLRDNWFMGSGPVKVATLGELLERLEGFADSFKLTDDKGNPIEIRMGDRRIIFQTQKP
jgi:hypothetical protein